MSFVDKVDEHIDYMLNEGVLPDVDDIMEMDVWGQQAGPQASGPEGGPVSPPSQVFPWVGNLDKAPPFPGASMGTAIPPAMFSSQPNNIPPAMFSGAFGGKVAASEDEDDEVIAAVLADLEALGNE